jgi:hypothetical protein
MDFNKALDKIRKLTDLADDPRTPEHEAASARAKAEAMMREYRVEEEQLIAQDPTAIEPTLVVIDLSRKDSPYQSTYISMFANIAYHCGVLPTYRWGWSESERVVQAHVVGYESDLRYAEFLFTAARLVFSERMEPKVDPKLGDQVNAYRLRNAGIERPRISEMLWGTTQKAQQVTVLYKRECDARGEDAAVTGKTVSAKVFRAVYAESFNGALARRLRVARNAADSVGGALVLSGRQERVQEAFYAHFPEYRPSTEVAVPEKCKTCEARKAKGLGPCRAHSFRITKADQARYERMTYSPAAQAGRTAGKDAADAVQLNRAEPAKRIEEHPEDRAARDLKGEIQNW